MSIDITGRDMARPYSHEESDMEDKTHTRWRWGPGGGHCPESERLFPVDGDGDAILMHNAYWPILPEHKALIAAAPALLAACEEALVVVLHYTPSLRTDARETVAKQLRAAIARAKGD